MVAALLVGQERRGSLLDQLLVAPLQRAVPGADHDHVAVGVGQHLRLDVPGPVQVALDEALAPAERADRLAHRAGIQLRDLLQRPGDLQAPAAAAEGRLDGHRQAVLGGEGDHLVRVGHRVRGAGHQRRAGPQRDVPGGDLVAEIANRLRGRADPGESRVQHRLGEVGVLAQEAVAGVHRVGTGLQRRVDHLLDHQVGLRRRAAAECEGLVGHPGVQGVAVGVGVDRHRSQPRVPGCPDDPDGDLAAIGDEHLAHASAS